MVKNKAVGCFIEYNKKFLILHRLPAQYQGDTWGLVGGKIKPNESSKQALLRELKEEIKFDASKENLEFLGDFTLQYSDVDWEFATYRIKLKQPISIKLDPSEFQAFMWITPDECYTMQNLMSGFYALLKKVERRW